MHGILLNALFVLTAPPAEPLAPGSAAPTVEDPQRQPPPREHAYEDPFAESLARVEGGLTADEVARRASISSPEIGVRAADLEVAAAQLDRTMYQFLPVISLEARYARLSPTEANFGGNDGFVVGAANEGPLGVQDTGPGTPPLIVDSAGVPVMASELDFSFENPLNQFSLEASLSVPISDYVLRLVPARRGALARVDSVALAENAERLKVESDARVAYYNWLRTIATETAALQSLERTQALLRDTQAAFDAGLVPQSEVMQLEASVARTEAGIVRARAMRGVAEQNLAVIMDDEPRPYRIGEDVLAAKDGAGTLGDLPELIAEAEAQRIELESLERSIESVDQGIRASRAGYYPRLDGFFEATYANPNQRFFPQREEWNGSWVAGVSLTWVFNQAMMTKADIREHRAGMNRLEARSESLRRGIRMEVTVAHAERQTALANISHNGRAVRSAAEAGRVAADLHRVGRATGTDVLVAEQRQLDATLAEINARIDLQVANSKLLYALGRTEALGEPRAAP